MEGDSEIDGASSNEPVEEVGEGGSSSNLELESSATGRLVCILFGL